MKRHGTVLCLMVVLLTVGLRASRAEKIPEDRGAAGLWRELLQLRTTASAMHVTAHPDDEDGPMLAMLSRGQGAHVSLLTLNRGEGGADLIGPYFFDYLGVLRTLELMQADRYYGADQYFTHVVDYGFSKTLQESLDKWGGKENLLRDVVYAVRRDRPDVIIARFRGDQRDGHGNHQASGVMAQLVIEAAGDPNRFPEQIKAGLKPWQPKKVYHDNIWPEFRPEDKGDCTLPIDTGQYDPVLGRSYAQISSEGLSFQRSQGTGGGRPIPPGEFKSCYKLFKSAIPGYSPEHEQSFFDGIDTTITGMAKSAGSNPPEFLVAGLKTISESIDAASQSYTPTQPEKTVPPLAQGLEATRKLLAQVRSANIELAGKEHIEFLLSRKEQQFQDAIADALAIDMEATVLPDEIPTGPFAMFMNPATFNQAIPGQTFSSEVRLVNRSSVSVTPVSVAILAPQGWKVETAKGDLKTLASNQPAASTFRITVAEDAQPSEPYWHRDSIEESEYKVDVPSDLGMAFPDPPAWGQAKLQVAGTTIELREPLTVTVHDPQFGTIRPPLSVAPAITVRFPIERGIIPVGRNQYKVSVVVHSSAKGPAQGTLKLDLPSGWKSRPAATPFSLAKEDEEANYDFAITVPTQVKQQDYQVRAVASYKGREYSNGYRTVTARDLGRANLYRPAVHHVRAVDVKVASNLKLGYVMGSGDDIPQALGLLGIHPEMLGASDLANAELSIYDAIVLGVRAYAVRGDLKTYNGRLLDYVKHGGVLIVQYQTPEFDNNFGPYPYKMTNNPEEVSEEDSELAILDAKNPVFNSPNRITMADFGGWVEERGSKFLKTWDSHYEPLLESHDKGQEAQKGGMMYAPYGKGVYIYSAYAWYRQLPEAVPGAWRIYANMISLRRTLLAGSRPTGKSVANAEQKLKK